VIGGFTLYEGIPSTATFCRFIQSTSNTSSLQKIFDGLVQKAFAAGVMNGTQAAMMHQINFFDFLDGRIRHSCQSLVQIIFFCL
jgi:hypothetical protein